MKKIYYLFFFLFLFTACKKNNEISKEQPVNNGQSVIYKLKNGGQVTVFIDKEGRYIVGGDVILSAGQISYLKTQSVDNKGGVTTESTFVDQFEKLWPDGVVYYTISDAGNSVTIKNAIQHWEAYTPIRFVQRTNQGNYIDFSGRPISGAAGSSKLGMVGGRQTLETIENVGFTTVVHEIGHAVGLMHEQTRVDRDNYINMNYANINDDWKPQYDTYNVSGRSGSQTGPLDFNSVMIYPSYAASAAYPGNTTPQMTKKDGSQFDQGTFLSQGDIDGVKSLYQKVYIRITQETITQEVDNDHTSILQNVYVFLYKDPNGTIPLVLTRKLKIAVISTETQYWRTDSSTQTIVSNVVIEPGKNASFIGTNDTMITYDYGMSSGYSKSSIVTGNGEYGIVNN